MAHYEHKGKSRLATRTSRTNPEWLRTASQIGLVVNNWAFRSDLAVYAGEDSAEGQAVAAYYADISEIEVNLTGAFGFATTPEMVGDFTERATQYEFPNATGVIYHEALHARHTNWDTNYLSTLLDPNEQRAFMLLEESRIERKGVIERPENKLFLRSSALNLALEEVNEENLEAMGSKWQGAMLAGLALARYDAGVVEADDVKEIYTALLPLLGSDLYNELRAIWVEFQTLVANEADKGADLAKKWVALLREAEPEGEPNRKPIFGESESGESESGEGEGEGESGEGDSESADALKEALANAAMNAELNASDSLGDQQTKEDWDKEVQARQAQSKNNQNKQRQAAKIFDKAVEATGSGSGSRLEEKRVPTSIERAAAVKIGQMLEKAKYRERSIHEVKSVMPMGRLNARAAVQNAAAKSMGRFDQQPAWRKKVRKHTDDPILRLGVMVDISGSMGSAMNAMATTAWVLGEAGHRIQAKTAMVYYGSGVFPTLRVGQRLDKVSVYTAPDGTEKFDEAWQALDGEVRLTFGEGVRMLVIVSDGNYTPKETERAVAALKECQRNGVAVLWITPKSCYDIGARRIIREAAWGVHLTDLDTDQIAMSVGKAATDALGKVESLA
jgi:hypothetical protein